MGDYSRVSIHARMLNDGPSNRPLPLCGHRRHQGIYESMIPLLWASVSPPEQENEAKHLLIGWLDHLVSLSNRSPMRCLNCSCTVNSGNNLGICFDCKHGRTPRRWSGFKNCRTCGHFGRVRDFMTSTGREQLTCNHCLQVLSVNKRNRALRAIANPEGGAQGSHHGGSAQGSSHHGGLHRHHPSRAGDHARSGSGGGAPGHSRTVILEVATQVLLEAAPQVVTRIITPQVQVVTPIITPQVVTRIITQDDEVN
ncbi:hypothetical protein F5X97DRAFT_319818 [Nemania serpens]|nr:hypothetical protein F5X97DRAFT_319818 [Nemania serpens]